MVGVICVFILAGSVSATVPDPIAYFPFDTIVAGETPNAVDPANDGWVNGATLIAGKVGAGAMDFDGVDDRVSVDGGLSALDGSTTQTTIAFWLKCNPDEIPGPSTYAPIIAIENQPSPYYVDMGVTFKGGNETQSYVLWDIPDIRQLPSPLVDRDMITDDTWHHWAFTSDKTLGLAGANYMKTYYDGQFLASGGENFPVDYAVLSFYEIGADVNGVNWLHGALDELAIWDVALTEEEIREFAGITLYLLGDANLDGLVSADDYASVQANFGNTGTAGGGLLGDANHDGLVSADDYASVQANFGNTSGGMSAVPEPATLGLLAMGLIAVLRRRTK